MAVGFFNFFQDGLQAVFKLAAKFGSGEHRAQIEGDNALVAQDVRDVAVDDAAGEAFDDGGFADAGLADEDRVVLGAAREHLDDAANLLVAADDRIELAAAGELGQVLGVLLKGLIFRLRVLVSDALAAAHAGQAFEHRLVRRAQEASSSWAPSFFWRERASRRCSVET